MGVGSLCVGLSQLCMKQSFALAPRDTGPLSAVVSSDVLVISVFCHFVYHELMNRWQIAGVVSIMIGLIIMGLGSSDGLEIEDEDESKPLLAFLFAVLSMLFFAAAVLSIRCGFTECLAAWSGFIVRMMVMLLLGASILVFSITIDGWPQATFANWCIPVSAGVLQAAGVFFVNKALQFQNTGIANAIFESNSAIVTILQLVVFQEFPGWPALLGMVIVIAAVMGMALSERSAALSEVADIQASVEGTSLTPMMTKYMMGSRLRADSLVSNQLKFGQGS